ncbi:hypothetical protein A5722_27335 [Mycobacterium vulneris]|nr:hypothetical protein A5722_27335 [Mycolicibacterium vulneris]OCB67016.1 hypothetical protein A5729_10440 [Mycolicibacterium vulneris]
MGEGQELPPTPADFERFTPRTARALVRGGCRHVGIGRAATDAELPEWRAFGYLGLVEVRAADR